MNGLDRFSTLLSTACINVALVPVGRIAEERFHSYANRLNRYHSISMQQITPYPEYNHAETVFENLSWQEGFLRLSFIPKFGQPCEPLEVDWDGVQAQKRCLVVVGICHCPSESDLVHAFGAFQVALGKFPTHVISRWCAFESTEEISSLGEKDLTRMLEAGLEVFHQDRALDDGRSAVDFQMEIVMTNICTKLLHKFELLICEANNAVQALQLPSMTSAEVAKSFAESYVSTLLNGITYPGDSVALTKLSEKMNKRRQTGRLQVWTGSLFLLSGVPLDASEYFTQAVANCNAADDKLWLIVALEGLAAAAFINEYNGMLAAEDDGAGVRVEMNGRIVELLERALSQFSALDGEQYLLIEAESVLKLCRYLCYANSDEKGLVLCRMSSFLDKMDTVCDALPKTQSLSDTAVHPLKIKLDFCLEAAVLCSYMGLNRKIALFTLHAASILVDLGADWRDVWSIQAASASFCGVGTRFVANAQAQSSGHQQISTWTHVKCALLRSLISLAARAHRHADKFDYLFQLLALAKTEPEAEELLEDFASILNRPYGSPAVHFSKATPPPFPVVERVHPPAMSNVEPKVIRETGAGGEKQHKSTFLYSPYQDRHANDKTSVSRKVLMTVIQGEECTLFVDIANPCAFTLRVDRIALAFAFAEEDVICRSEQLDIPPFATHQACALTFRPLSKRDLRLCGVKLTLFGVTFTCAIPEREATIRVLPPLPLLLGSPTASTTFELIEGEHGYSEVVVKNGSGCSVDRISLTTVIYVDGDQLSSSTVHQNTSSLEGLVAAAEEINTRRRPSLRASAQEKYLVSYKATLGSNMGSNAAVMSTNNLVHRVVQLESSIPDSLDAGEIWKLSVRFTAIPGLKKAVVKVLYGSSGVTASECTPGEGKEVEGGWYQRQLDVSFGFKVSNGLKVVNLELQEATDPSLAQAMIDVANHTRDVRFKLSCLNHAAKLPEQHTLIEPHSIGRVCIVIARKNIYNVGPAGLWEEIFPQLEASSLVRWTCEHSPRHGILTNHLRYNRDFLSSPPGDTLRIVNAPEISLEWTTTTIASNGTVLGTLKVFNTTDGETLEGVTVSLRPNVVDTESFHCSGTLKFRIDSLPPGEEAVHSIAFFCLEPDAEMEVVAQEKDSREWIHRFPAGAASCG